MKKEESGIFLNDEELDGVVGGTRLTKHNMDIEMDSPSNIVRPSLNPSAAVEIPGVSNGQSRVNLDDIVSRVNNGLPIANLEGFRGKE